MKYAKIDKRTGRISEVSSQRPSEAEGFEVSEVDDNAKVGDVAGGRASEQGSNVGGGQPSGGQSRGQER